MSAVANRRVVVTGKIANESRVTAQEKLREAGAIIQSAVGKDTDILVTGDAVGATKINKAKALGVEIISWAEAFGDGTRVSGSTPAAEPRAPMPSVRQWNPMLCKKGELPAGGRYVYEIKWDGIRGVVSIKDGQVSIQSRSGLSDLTNRYPDVTAELAGLPNCVLDGELVQMGDELGLLPEGCDPDPVARFVAFDILEDDGDVLTGLPFQNRRVLLELRVPGGCYVACSPLFADGEKLLSYVTEHGLEGLVAKDGSSRYIEGGRGPEWLKIKVRNEQEFCVLGWTKGEGAREWAFGALVLGAHDENGEMVYCGRVGTGWDDEKLGMLVEKMEPLRSETCEYVGMPRNLKDVVWLRPGLIVQIAFQKWTDGDRGDRRLWHPSYLRVRDDKEPRDVGLDA